MSKRDRHDKAHTLFFETFGADLVQEQQEERARQIEEEASPAISRELLPVAMHFVEAIRKGMTYRDYFKTFPDPRAGWRRNEWRT